MKRLLVSAVFLFLGLSSAVAQETGPAVAESSRNAAADFSGTSTSTTALILPRTLVPLSFTPFATPEPPSTSSLASAAPEASPSPEPKLLYSSRDDYRWQLGIGLAWYRFRSNIFSANAIGTKTSVTYYTNEWFGVEGNVTAAFASQIYANEHVKVLVYGAGPKVAWRQRRWEPWMHAIFGGSHVLPKTANNSKNAFAIEAGGGGDYRWNPRLSFRLEGNYVRTTFFSRTQNNFELMGGVVFHF